MGVRQAWAPRDTPLRAAGIAPRVVPGTAHELHPAELGGSHGRIEAPEGLEDRSQAAGEAVALSPAHRHADLIPDPQEPQGGSWWGKGAGEGHREARGWWLRSGDGPQVKPPLQLP